MDAAGFNDILTNLALTDNEARNQAEEKYDQLPNVTKLSFLSEVALTRSSSTEMRSLAAVLIRRLLSSSFEDSFRAFGPHMQEQVKLGFIQAIIAEPVDQSLRKKLCDTTAELARNLMDDDCKFEWHDLLKYMFEWAASDEVHLCEASLQIFSNFPGVFGSKQAEYKPLVKKMLAKSFQDSNISIRNLAAKSMCCFLLANEFDKNLQKEFEDLLPQLLIVVNQTIQEDDDSALKSLVDMTETLPKFFKSQMSSLFELCLGTASNIELEDSFRQLAFEGIVSLSESAPGMIRKCPEYVPRFVSLSLMMMSELDDDQAEWISSDTADDDDDMTNAVAAESGLDRFACSIGGKAVLPCLVMHIQNMLSSPDWKSRHALLMALSASAEGCKKQMENSLDDVVKLSCKFLEDDHPKVRYAACNAIGQMSTDFSPHIEKKYHAIMVPALLRALDDSFTRVQAHAGAALVNFSEECPKGILAGYLEPIITKLYDVLQAKIAAFTKTGTKLVLEQVVTTLAAVADTAQEHFNTHYDKFMPALKNIMSNARQPELRLLSYEIGTVLKMVHSLISLTPGHEDNLSFNVALAVSLSVLRLVDVDMEEVAADDPQVPYLISAFARMCKILGSDFTQFLPFVIPQVMKVASHKPEVAVVSDEDEQTLNEEEGWQFVALGEQQSFGIRTPGLEDKATACQMLVCYVRELKEGFLPYVESTAQLMIPLLKFFFHDGVRMSAAECLPYLMESAVYQGPDFVKALWVYIFPELLAAIKGEPETDVLSEHLASLSKCLECTGRNNIRIDNEQMTELLTVLSEHLENHFTKTDERLQKRKDDDYDDVAEEKLVDEDDEDTFVLSKMADVLHSLFVIYKDDFIPCWEQIMLQIQRLLEPERGWSDFQWGICIWDDVIEFCGPAAIKYKDPFLKQMLDGVLHMQPEARQACGYGCGIMAQFGGPPFVEFYDQALAQLVSCITQKESREISNISATENCVSAVAKILRYGNRADEKSIESLLSFLPIVDDKEEAVHVYDYVQFLLKNYPVLILGENNVKLPSVIKCIAEAFENESTSASPELTEQLKDVIRHVKTTELWPHIVSSLDSPLQKVLHEAVPDQAI